MLMDDDVMEWACKAAEAEYNLRRAIKEFCCSERGLKAQRERFRIRGDERAAQIFDAAVSEMTEQGLIQTDPVRLKLPAPLRFSKI